MDYSHRHDRAEFADFIPPTVAADMDDARHLLRPDPTRQWKHLGL
jgi:hypothetical protein